MKTTELVVDYEGKSRRRFFKKVKKTRCPNCRDWNIRDMVVMKLEAIRGEK